MNKDFILKKRKDFLRVAKGERVVVSTLILQAAQSLSDQSTSYKIGFTTTKKLGKAHIRNRARRRMRAAAREVFAKHGKSNIEYVMVGRYNTAHCPFTDLINDLKYGVKKINRIIENKTTKENLAEQNLS